MFFWKYTRSGRVSSSYISLVLDFHESIIKGDQLHLSFQECMNILILIQDVEKLNGTVNKTAGLLKTPYRSVVNQLGFDTTHVYQETRFNQGLVLGQMMLGNHMGSPLDYGKDIHDYKDLALNIRNLTIQMFIDAKTGLAFNWKEDKLKAYRNEKEFMPYGKYFDLMPKHICLIEIVGKMSEYDRKTTENFLINILKWHKI